uniref:Uncharacterized protein n=1 Tax=Panagrolaimus sp. ES5 TaxID=591445 RepID=A0AC34FRN5_9BILA
MKLKARLGSDFKFQSDKPPRDCARLVVQRTDSYNDGILVCRAAEDIYFTGWVMFWDPFDVNVERERYQRIFDTLNNDWDGVWPERCDGVSSSLDESDNDSETPSDNTNVDGDASSNLDASSQASDVDEDAPIPINSDPLIDFDDRHSLPPFDHNPQLGSSQRLSPNTSAPFPVNDANDGVAEENSAAPSNNGSNSTDRELAGIIRMANLGDPCSVSSLSNSSNQVIPPPPVQQTPVLIEQNWDIKFVPKRQFWETECSSLSGFEDEEDAASDPPNALEVDPRDYPEVETSEEEEPFDRDEYYLREQKCLSIDVNIKNFWKCVRKAAEERDEFIKKLQNQLLKERCYSVDEMKCLNSKVQLIEGDLNRIVPVAPKFRVSYEAGSDKNIVIHKGYAYKREGDSNVFRCTFIYKFNPCHSYIFVNEDDCLIERSLCDHYHIGFEEFTEDEPPPVATPVSLPRIVHNIPAKNGKFTKMMKFLNELLVEICDWRCQIELSMENVKIVYQYISELEANGDDLLMSRRKGICSKMVVMDAKNLMKCIRFDKLDAEKLA